MASIDLPFFEWNDATPVGDGRHDDAPMLQAALDQAAAQGGAILRLPHRDFRLCAPLHLGSAPLILRGAEPGARLLIDHPGPALVAGDGAQGLGPLTLADLAFEGRHPAASGLSLVGAGPGETVEVGIERCRFEKLTDAVELDVDEAARVELRVVGCRLAHNLGRALRVIGTLGRAVVRETTFEDNPDGGVFIAAVGLELLHNQFLRQPAALVIDGRRTRGVAVVGNTFTGGTGRGVIELLHVHRFRVENNVFESPSAAVPPVYAEGCTAGRIDVPVLLVDCADVVSSAGYLVRSAYDAPLIGMSGVWSLARSVMPEVGLSPAGVPPLLRLTAVAPPPLHGLRHVRMGSAVVPVLPEDPRVPGHALLEVDPAFGFDDTDALWIAFAVRYTRDVPAAGARMRVRLTSSSSLEPVAEWDVSPPELSYAGEVVRVVVGTQHARPTGVHGGSLLHVRDHHHLTVEVWPFGQAHHGYGAQVTRAVLLRLPDAQLPGRSDLHPEVQTYPPPTPLLDPFPVLEELVQRGRLLTEPE